MNLDEAKALVESVKGFVTRRIDEAKEELRKEFAQMQSELKYCGVHQRASEYRKNNCVTHGGCMWIATSDKPRGIPGESADWQLAVKSGRNSHSLGRDERLLGRITKDIE